MAPSQSGVETFLRFLGTGCLLTAVLASLTAFGYWWQLSNIQKMNAGGVETIARIDGGWLSTRVADGKVTEVSLDLSWTDRKNNAHTAANVHPSVDYGKNFVATVPYKRIIVDAIPIKYLASDPDKFVFHRDPAINEARKKEDLQLALKIAMAGLLGLPLFFWFRFQDRRRAREDSAEA